MPKKRNAGAPRIVFSWSGLPQYAARLIRAAIDELDEDCAVIGSRPSVPVSGMEDILKQNIHWIDRDNDLTWKELGLPVPRVFFQSGWSYPAFSSLGAEVKKCGGKVIGLSDANWRGDFRQLILGPIAFRMLYRKHFDSMLVPGRQGVRLMKYFGVRKNRIRTGMYGADPSLFYGGLPLAQRPKKFLFVGQFVERKNILGLINAFLKFSLEYPEWTLHICGNGRLRTQIPKSSRIVVEDFVQPAELVKRYQDARFFVLPSLVEAWGLVVHEATLCGCGLILSDAVGSGDDLASPLNSIRYKALSEDGLLQSLKTAAAYDENKLASAELQSRTISKEYGPICFAKVIAELVSE